MSERAIRSDEGRRVLYLMSLIRVFDERALELVADGSIRGTSHPYVGQEAVAVGVCTALQPEDQIISTHRGHGHLLAKGGDPKRLMAELFGKAAGYGSGRGGTQHVADLSIGHLGSFGITGGGIPIGTGAALSAQMQENGQVTAVFFGDGAVNQGVFHESLNLAALWHLPVVYVCENNFYAMSTSVHEASAGEHIWQRASGYGMRGVLVDGMDVMAVADAVGQAVDDARTGRGPALLECETYRFLGHSKSDKCVYRTREEEQQWRIRDPIPSFRDLLLQRGLVSDADALAITAAATAEVDAAVEFARQSPFPDPQTMRRTATSDS